MNSLAHISKPKANISSTILNSTTYSGILVGLARCSFAVHRMSKMSSNQLFLLKEPGPIASDFSQTFGDFGIRRKLVFFSLPLVNFTAGKGTVRKILMKM